MKLKLNPELNLCSFVDDIQLEILSFLDPNFLCALRSVNKTYKKLAENDDLWLNITNKKFGKNSQLVSRIPDKSWFSTYSHYKKQQKLAKEEWAVWKKKGIFNPCCHPPRRVKATNPKRNPTDTSGFQKLKVFEKHPDSTHECVLKFKVNLEESTMNFHNFEINLNNFEKKLTKNYLQNAMIRYDQFLKLKKKFPDSYLVPALDIEIIWISHLLRPHLYQNDCQKIYGKVFDHKLQCSKFEVAIRNEALIETQNLWKQEYKSDYFFEKIVINPKIYEMGARRVTDKRETEYYQFDTPPNVNMKVDTKHYDALKFSFSVDDVLQDRKWIKTYSKFMKSNRSVFDSENYIKNTHGYVKSYERYLYLLAKYPNDRSGFYPTSAIDLVWHSHMLHPFGYKEDMEDILDEFLDHIPEENPTEDLQKVWENEFGGNEMKKDHYLQ
eukprot:gene9806-2131_t